MAFIRDNGVTCPGCGKRGLHRHPQVQPHVQDPPGRHRGQQAPRSTCAPRPPRASSSTSPPSSAPPASKLPFGVCQVGKSFRNEITPGNFIFRIREFEQMELEFFCQPGTDLEWFQYWRELLPQVAGGSGPEGGEPPPARPRARRAGLLLQGHHRLRVHVPLRLGRAVGRGRPHRLRPQAAPGALRQEISTYFDQENERALYPLCQSSPPWAPTA